MRPRSSAARSSPTRSSWSRAATCSTRWWCWSAATRRFPAAVMALARLDIPGLVLYGGSIAPGRFQGRDVTIQDVFEAVGAHAAGTMTDADFDELERQACPGAGACGGQFTANTMATVCETLGISPFGSASVPAADGTKVGVARQRRRAGHGPAEARPAAAPDHHARRVRERHRRRRGHRRLDQRRAAPAGHRARGAACRSTSTTSTAISARVPLLADLKPGGRFVATDLHRAGGIPLVAQRLLEGGHAARRRDDDHRPDDRRARRAKPTETPARRSCGRSANPIKPTGGLVILKGNLAPEGAVVKVAGYDTKQFIGPGARVRQRRSGVRGGAAPARIKAGRRRRHPLRRPERRAGHARDARRDRRHHGRRPRRFGGAGHRRPLLRGHPRPDGRPRRAGSGAAAARSPPCATATSSRSTSTARTLNVDVPAAELADRLAQLKPVPLRDRHRRDGRSTHGWCRRPRRER